MIVCLRIQSNNTIMKKFSILALLFIVALSSCKKDDDQDTVTPTPPNEEEVITKMEVRLSPSMGGDTVIMTFNDPDGDGGVDPTITGGILAANTDYSGDIQLYNETETPIEIVTEEILEEDDEHQFFFDVQLGATTWAYADMDDNMNPIGQMFTLTTADALSGTLKVTLRHEPEKEAEGVSDGDITNAGGETDIEVEFDVEVQ